MYVAVHPDDISFAFDASNAAFNSASFIFDNILKQYLKVAMDAFEELESWSVKVHLSLTCSFSNMYEAPYPEQQLTPLGSLVKLITPYLTL